MKICEMGSDHEPPSPPSSTLVKQQQQHQVHHLMCSTLENLLHTINHLFPLIEAARPRCSSGIDSLCLLNRAIEKSNLLLQYCSDSSKLYLALTGDAIMSRFERSRVMFQQSLSQIHNMVPISLALKISHFLTDVQTASFVFDTSQQEAGNVLRALLHHTTSAATPLSDMNIDQSEIQALQYAALRLQINSPKALLIEKRAIRKLYDKFRDTDPTKRKILKFLLYLLNKYGKRVIGNINDSPHQEGPFPFSHFSIPFHQPDEQHVAVPGCRQDEVQTEIFTDETTPHEFKCPISLRLMYDPVVIASGQTFERMWIQRWFDEDHDTCPITKTKLPHLSLTPNTIMKDMIGKWCKENGFTLSDPHVQLLSREISSSSIVSFGSSMNDIQFPADFSNISLGFSDTSYVSNPSHVKIPDAVSLVNVDSDICQSHPDRDEQPSQKLLTGLDLLSLESQRDVVENVKNHFHHNAQAFNFVTTENFAEPLVRFLQTANDLCYPICQKIGSQLLLAFVNNSRDEVACLPEETISVLETLLGSDASEEAVAILAVLSTHKCYTSKIAASSVLTSILKNLDSHIRECQESALTLLHTMSSNSETCFKIRSSDFVPKLVPLMYDSALAKSCILVLKNFCDKEEGRLCIAETSGCIASIAELLDTGSRDDQEPALSIFLSLCSQSVKYSQLVMDEGVIPALCNITMNGSDQGKMRATELLRLLRDTVDSSDEQESPEAIVVTPKDCDEVCKESKSSSKTSGFFGKKIPIFRIPTFLASRKKK